MENSDKQQLEQKQPAQKGNLSNDVEVWKKTIEVQQHFNDLQLKIRTIAITVLGAILAVTAVAVKENPLVNVNVGQWSASLPLAALLPLLAIVIWCAFFIMDYHWYHRLLVGSVRHGEEIEEKLKPHIQTIGLTQRISKESPSKILWWEFHSRDKMKWFYNIITVALFLLTIVLFWIRPSENASSVQNQSPILEKETAAQLDRTADDNSQTGNTEDCLLRLSQLLSQFQLCMYEGQSNLMLNRWREDC